MSTAENKAVFLSYASQDAAAVIRVAEALRGAGVEVWFDQNELVGGDAWDAKIRQQIAECALFVPVISAATQARGEGYFRLEWKLAVDRSHLMAHDQPFLLPVVIDATSDAAARVPPEFRAVQWTRLLGGETPEKFCVRVKKLLSGSELEAGRPRPAPRDEGVASPAKSAAFRSWLGPAILGAAAIVAVAIWQPWKNSAPGSATVAPPPVAASAPTAPLSEVRKLVAQARALFDDGDDSNHENFFLADDLLKKALAIDSTDGEVWAAQAELSSDLVMRSYDRSATRLQILRTQAERAAKLAPASAEAQLAYAGYLTVASFLSPNGERFSTEALDVIQKLNLTAAQQRRALRTQLMALVVLGRLDEGVAAIERDSALTGGDPGLLSFAAGQFLFAGRYDEAEKAISRSLALRRLGRAQMQDVILKLTWQGDLDGAAASLAQWPSWLTLEDRGAFLASQVWLWRREPDKAIAVLAPVSRDFLNDSTFVGPKAVLVALAHEMAGNAQAARAAWEDAKRVAMRIATEQLADQRALVWKAVAMARLGETAEAETIFRQLEQTKTLRSEFWSNAAPSALLRIALGHGDEVVAKFDKELRSNSVRTPAPTPRAALQLNPVFDSIRATPEFQRWLATAPAPKAVGESTAVVDQKSVAVLAFSNLSDDKANEYFSDGISEELLNVLGRVPGLRVAAPMSAFSFKGKNVSAQEIGQKLNVAYLVNGSVRRAGPDIRVVARLSRADTDEQIWTEKFNGEAKNVFALQDEIAGKIAAALSLKLGASARAAKPIDPEAYRLYLEGRHFWSLRTFGGFDRAEVALKQAVALEPESALIRAGLAELYATRGWYRAINAQDAGDNYALASAEAERAVALDPENAQAILARATIAIARQQSAEAARLLQRVQALAPNDASALNRLGDLMVQTGRLDAAVENYQRAMQLDPLSVYLVRDVVRQLLYACRFQDAIETVDRFEVGSPRDWRTIVWRAQALVQIGKANQAAVELKSILPSITPDDFSSSGASIAELVFSLRVTKCEAESEALAQRLLERHLPGTYLHAMVLAARGRMDEALPLLVAFPVGSEGRLFWGEMFDPVRDDPRFLRKIGEMPNAAEYKVARETLARMLKEQAAKK